MSTLLEVQNLRVSYRTRGGARTPALRRVSFALQRGETLGVLGESGSGKSTLGATLLRVLPRNAQVEEGAIRFEERDLLGLAPREMEKIRGARMAMIFQEPSLALHPTIRVGAQVEDVLAAHGWSGGERREKARKALAAVFAAETERIARAFPHQLSGGQRARVLIAQAICCGPSLIVADEPTASLDPEIRREILALFRKLRQEFQLSVIWITHDPGLLAGFADRVMVLYAGRVVEIGATEKVLASPQHPYTRALLRCLPPELEAGFGRHKEKLAVIAGEVALAEFDARRCLFESRCAERMEMCAEREPEMVELQGEHGVSCFRYQGEKG
jgi:oligopeptide/dipeptide ABC transporter ATP-binding protein